MASVQTCSHAAPTFDPTGTSFPFPLLPRAHRSTGHTDIPPAQPEVLNPTITFAQDEPLPSSPTSLTDSSIPPSWDYHAHLSHSPNHLITSPYTKPPHLLDLNSIARRYALLAKALTIMKPLDRTYATTPYKEAFNWAEVVRYLRYLIKTEAVSPTSDSGFEGSGSDSETEQSDKGLEDETLGDGESWSYFVIVFRSQIQKGTSRPYLGLLDEGAHEEAVAAGGLLKYWFGVPDENGRNLATCVWRHRDDAKKGGAGPVCT
ncbi:hypothetical protein BJ508DRAFT_417262 [Ascobolus immersus RN42]|uniref:Uncharacterized protein n=1 Tax=Ascobolus immersus RN42 TaxID=1160509 RepID=A0A3N4HZ06_ASCIM|nr:hypothetical protein BJ508DRAFT_417262 [Ascobolus immersus RN42]